MEELIPLLWGMGWYKLTKEEIDKRVRPGSKGVYILGKGSVIYRTRSGRSLTNLNERLHAHRTEGKYDYFRFEYVASAKEAHEEECRRYHALGTVLGLSKGEKGIPNAHLARTGGVPYAAARSVSE